MQLFVAKTNIFLHGRVVSPGETLSDREMEDRVQRLLDLKAVERIFDTRAEGTSEHWRDASGNLVNRRDGGGTDGGGTLGSRRDGGSTDGGSTDGGSIGEVKVGVG